MAEKEDAAASLGYSEELSVEYPPAHAIPEVGQRPEDGAHVAPAAGCEQPDDVLGEQPGGAQLVDEPGELEEQPASGAVEPGAVTGGGEVLAGPTGGDEQVVSPGRESCPEIMCSYLADVAEHRQLGEAVRQHAPRGFVDLDGGARGAPGAGGGEIEPADAREQAHVMQRHG
nr:hypothetical protein [Longispora albida]